MDNAAALTWHLVCRAEEIDLEDARRIDIDGKAYAVFHTPRGFYATEGLCTHERANLADGMVEGDYVSCPKHNSRFHIPSGKAMRVPARVDLKTFPVKTENGSLYIGLPS